MRTPRHVAVLDDTARALRRRGVPASALGARLSLAGHILARAWQRRSSDPAIRRALLHVGLAEAALRGLGRTGMLDAGDAFYPLFLLPDFHGPHFDEALRRLLLPDRGPFVAHLAVTGACPNRCSYCYADAGGAGAPDLGDDLVLDVGRAIAREGIPLVILSGGEPLARFERVLRLVTALTPASEVRLATSGVGLSDERVALLRGAGLKVLAVSLDSHDAARVNAARGYRGAFDAAVAALRASAEAGLVTFATAVVDRGSFASGRDVDRFLRFVRGIHPGILVNFLPKLATGRAASGGGFGHPAEYAPVARRIAEVIAAGGYRATVFHAPIELLMGCVGGGLRQMNVDIRGNVTACISGASFGNVLVEPFDVLRRRFSIPGARLKRGFFCASVGDRAGGATVLDPGESLQALQRFYATSADTLFQRVLDVAGGPVAWLAR